MTVSCAQKEDPTPEKPVVTDEMYAVEADAETGVVVFTFKGANLNPYWTVVLSADALPLLSATEKSEKQI